MPQLFALLVLLLSFSPFACSLDTRSTSPSATTFAYLYPPRASARPTASIATNQTFYWFQTEKPSPDAPTPTLRGRILSTDHFSFTKYRITCDSQDASLGCTYKDFTITASGTSQLYYETVGSIMMSIGCEVSNTTAAVCSSRTHGEDLTKAATKTWKASDFPGFYPVIVTAEPTLEGRYEYDQYIYETHQPTVTAGGSVRQLSWGLLLALVGCVILNSQLMVSIVV
ncbi:hypothetical protein TWF506_005137 [Arthrobotrys conoides]|uniref:AA1-like domain-containing protein n=1 Tax=Arthrobotrys conoides TaxID=74498 RepID=A0AAN8NB90_9PEZI